jgi:hypothetical protein
MPEIPLGFSFAEDDDGFIIRNKTADGVVTEIKMSRAELNAFKAAIDLWSDRRLSQTQVEAGSGIQAIVVHPVARALLQSDVVQENVLLTVEGSSTLQMTLSFPLPLAVELLRRIPRLLSEMRAANPTRQ